MAFAAMVTLPLSASNWMKVHCLNPVRPFHLFVPRGTGGEVKPGVKAGLNHGWREGQSGHRLIVGWCASARSVATEDRAGGGDFLGMGQK